MNPEVPKYVSTEKVGALIGPLSASFAVVSNPPYIFPPYEVYPLSAPKQRLDEGLVATVTDMDGTTTTTEPLCIHSLDTMTRRASGRHEDPSWPGLDPKKDYPNIIGNSTTKHVEYLVKSYGAHFDQHSLRRFTLRGCAWTLSRGKDEQRKRDARSTLTAIGVGEILEDPRFLDLMKEESLDTFSALEAVDCLSTAYESAWRLDSITNQTRACIEIYYQRYHEVLGIVAEGRGPEISESILGVKGAYLVGPMPGVALFLALIKGWLDTAAADCFEPLAAHLLQRGELSEEKKDAARLRLRRLGRYMALHPAKIALVTSSIHYEADLVLSEVFRILREQIAEWPVAAAIKDRVLAGMASPAAYYDAFITASDSSEIRLKPHRDLYSIALHELGVYPADFGKVVGFEDSESGTIAIRTAGISTCCALPFHMTAGHHFEAATHVCPGGLPEVLLNYGLFLEESLLEAVDK